MKQMAFVPCAGVLSVALFLFFSAAAAAADDPDEDWRRRIASPSYGLGLTVLELSYQVEGEDDRQSDTYAMPGFDLRHFNGVNVTPAGGFFYGYEIAIGAVLQGQGNEYDTFPDFDERGPYRLENAFAGGVRLLLKHGYRFPVTAEGRVDLGFELGLGASAGFGSITFQDLAEDGGSYTHFSDEIGPAFEVGFEGGYRVTDHFRYVGRLSLQAGAPLLRASEEELGDNNISAGTAPILITLRFGFTRDH